MPVIKPPASAPRSRAPTVAPDVAGGVRGAAEPGAAIEAINLSDNQDGMRIHHDDGFVIGQAGADGSFGFDREAVLPRAQAGDVLRFRQRTDDGRVSPWVTLRVPGPDRRNAVARLPRLMVRAQPDGTVTLRNANRLGAVSEPGARLRLVNQRTGEKHTVFLDDEGQLPPGARLTGQAGDVFSLALSDGTNNLDDQDVVGTVRCLPPPGATLVTTGVPARLDESMPATAKPLGGVTFAATVDAMAPKQGRLGDCYFVSSMSALAHADPDAVRNMLQDHGDGTLTARFFATHQGGFEEVRVTVDDEVWHRPGTDQPLYGSSGERGPDGAPTRWYPLLEKAYAAWKGSYKAIGTGDYSAHVLEAITGKQVRYQRTDKHSPDEMWAMLTAAVAEKRPTTCTTHPETAAGRFTNTGLVADHAYTVLDTAVRDGERRVLMRNPWGRKEPQGHGIDDGVFEVSMDVFMSYFTAVTTTADLAR